MAGALFVYWLSAYLGRGQPNGGSKKAFHGVDNLLRARERGNPAPKKRPTPMTGCRLSIVVYGAWNFTTPPS